MKSEEFYSISKNLFPMGVNSPVRYYAPYPIFIRSGHGSKIYDVDGKEYIDYCLAYGPMILGHNNERVRDAVKNALEDSWLFGAPTENEIKLGSIIKEAIPNIELLRFTNSGVEATMHAVRVARAFTKRKKIVMINGGYHGSYDSFLVNDKNEPQPGILEETAKNTLLVQFNDLESLEKTMRENRNEIAAMIIEPVMGNVGLIPPKDGYIKGVREITEKYDSLLIVDEVITGFRNSFGSAQKEFGIEGDLVTLGKIIGGGFPIGAFGGREDIMNLIRPKGNVFHAGTFAGNPISMVAGYETLRILKEMDYGKILNYTEKIAEKLREMDENITVNIYGSMFQVFFKKGGVENYSQALLSNREKYLRMFRFLMNKGIYIPPSQFETNFVSFSHSKIDMEKTLYAFEEFFKSERDL